MKNVVKKEFVRRVLDDESRRFLQNQTKAIQSRLESHSGVLLGGRSIDVTTNQDMDGQFSLTHPVYERFLDSKRKYQRKRSAGYKTRRVAKIHNRFAFGHYYSIAGRLMYEFTEETASAIKKELANTTVNIEL